MAYLGDYACGFAAEHLSLKIHVDFLVEPVCRR